MGLDNALIHETPLVSVIIPVFNREDLIAETLSSVLAQTYTNWEIIIVDDHSTDNTAQKISGFVENDDRIKFLKRKKNLKGGSVCRNIGIEIAAGAFIIFLDSDDVLAPWCIEQRVRAMMQYPDIDFGVFHAETFFSKPGDGQLHTIYLSSKNHLYHFIAGHNVWQTSCPIWRKTFVTKMGGFNEKFQRFQDTEFHFRALYTQNVFYKPFYELKPDCYYRLAYPKRSIYFWDTVIDSNILYLEEVSNIFQKNIDINLYKTAITILLLYATSYSIKAHKLKANIFLTVIKGSPVKKYISTLNFLLCESILIACNKNLLTWRLSKSLVSRMLFYFVSRHIKKLI